MQDEEIGRLLPLNQRLATKFRVTSWTSGKGGASAPPQEMNEILGALAPEATWLQGLKAHQNLPRSGGAKAPPFPSTRVTTLIFCHSVLPVCRRPWTALLELRLARAARFRPLRLGRALLARLPLKFLPLCLVLDVFRVHACLSLLGWTTEQNIHHRGSFHSERSEESP